MPSKEETEKLAYHLWEQEGRPKGRELRHYYEAERILKERQLAEARQGSAPRMEQYQRPTQIAASELPKSPKQGGRNRRPPRHP